LRRVGVDGRQKIISEWSPFLPSNVDAAFSLLSESVPSQQAPGVAPARPSSAVIQDLSDDDDDDENLLSGGNICAFAFYSALTLFLGLQEGHPVCKNNRGDGGGGHWLVRI